MTESKGLRASRRPLPSSIGGGVCASIFLPKVKIEIVLGDEMLDKAVEAISASRSGPDR